MLWQLKIAMLQIDMQVQDFDFRQPVENNSSPANDSLNPMAAKMTSFFRESDLDQSDRLPAFDPRNTIPPAASRLVKSSWVNIVRRSQLTG